jgi:hypothetical protein
MIAQPLVQLWVWYRKPGCDSSSLPVGAGAAYTPRLACRPPSVSPAFVVQLPFGLTHADYSARMFLVFGYLISGWVSYGCYFATNLQFAWRFPLALQCLFPLLLLIGSPWAPFSPRSVSRLHSFSLSSPANAYSKKLARPTGPD